MRKLLSVLLLFRITEVFADVSIIKPTVDGLDIGLSLRTGISSTRISGSAKDSESNAFEVLVDPRIFLTAPITDQLNVTINAVYFDNAINLLDAIASFELDAAFNVWVGRFRPPSDRSNLSGVAYFNAWYFPWVVHRYPEIHNGRDNGAAVWGELFENVLKYQLGTFEGMGRNPVSSDLGNFEPPNDRGEPLMAARLGLNFLDKEPGYYTSSAWLGTKHILALGAVYQHQRNAVGYGDSVDSAEQIPAAGKKGDFKAYNFDIFYELPLGKSSAWTLEGAYYSYDSDHLDAFRQGHGYFALTAYLFSPMGATQGRFQPVIRYQNYYDEFADENVDRMDLQVNYVLQGHNARFSLVAVREQVLVDLMKQDQESLTLAAQLRL